MARSILDEQRTRAELSWRRGQMRLFAFEWGADVGVTELRIHQ